MARTDQSIRSYSLVEHLAKICWSEHWTEGRFVVFTVALDASGSKDHPALCVAGFVSNAQGWIDFTTEWNARLKSDGIEYFHMQEYLSAQEQFKGWDDKKKETVGAKLLTDLVGIIKNHAFRKFGCTIIAAFLKNFSADNRVQFLVDKAYPLAGRYVAKHVADWAAMERHPRLPELVFEDGDYGKGDL